MAFSSEDVAPAREGQPVEAESGHVVLEPRARRRFLSESGGCFDRLLDFPSPQIIHPLVQALGSLAEFDPRGVLLRLTRVVQAAQAGGYERDGLASELTLGLVNRYMDDHRSLLTEAPDYLTALRQILDIFARTGRPEALRASSRLADILRLGPPGSLP